MNNKNKVFILTFLIYASVHTMRMTYSFSKTHIKDKFEISSLFLGLMDALIYIALAVGTFFRYSLLENKDLTLLCLKTAIPTALTFSLIPLASLYIQHSFIQIPNVLKHTFLILSVTLFGFSQLAFFPAIITIFSKHFNLKTQGRWVGIWSSKSNVGNIFGFFLANFLVYQINCKWEITMILSSIIHIFTALMLKFLVEETLDQQEEKISTQYFFRYLKEMWKSTQFKLYILSFSFFKTILYSYQLWTPSFLSHNGYPHFSGYVPMIFDISTLLGSYLMGNLYEQKYNNKNSNVFTCLGDYKFFISSIFIILISALYVLCKANIIFFFVLAVLMGIFLGGIYNALENIEILNYTQNDTKKTDMLSTINIGLGCALVGIFQLIIGFFLHFNNHTKVVKISGNQLFQQKDHGMVYVIILFLGMIAMTLTFFRANLLRKNLSSNLILQEQKQQAQQKII